MESDCVCTCVLTEHIKRTLRLPTYAVHADTTITGYCAVTSEMASLPETL